MLRIFGQKQELRHGWGVAEWPWTWVRIAGFVTMIQNVYQRVALDKDPKTAVPPRWMFFDNDELDRWFKERREDA